MGYPHGPKYRVIDPRFVRFRIRSVISENLNAQLRIIKKLEHFKVTKAKSGIFGLLGEKTYEKPLDMTDPSEVQSLLCITNKKCCM